MEKIKDFLYDISDLFFSLLIIGIIFFVVSWKLTDTMSVSWFSNINQDDIANLEFADVTTPEDDILNDGDSSGIVEVVPEDPVVEEPVVEEPVVEIRDVAFVVADGSTGYRIATTLAEEGLIEDADAFLQKLGEMKLGNKLRAGTFKLNTGMTIEEIINKLAGQ